MKERTSAVSTPSLAHELLVGEEEEKEEEQGRQREVKGEGQGEETAHMDDMCMIVSEVRTRLELEPNVSMDEMYKRR